MPHHYDVILVGGGLANGLIALRLRQRHPAVNILMIEAQSQPGGNHTWSFHADDLTESQYTWISPLISWRWPGYDVRFPQFTRHLNGEYCSISSEQFAEVMTSVMGNRLLTNSVVTAITPDSVRLADGSTFKADAVIDGRGDLSDPALRVGFQAFVGQVWRLDAPHQLTCPILMDATVDQQRGYRFVYTLPLSPQELLIEDTHYIDQAALSADRARENITHYAASQGWTLTQLLREEHGMLPITLAGDHAAFWQQRRGQPCAGLRAGLFHPTTGYSLPLAASLADCLTEDADFSHHRLFAILQRFAGHAWREQRFFRMLNRMLFLAGKPDQRWRVMQRFYGLNDDLIARFYAGQLTLADKVRILSGKPPVPVGAAIKAILQNRAQQRAFR